MAQRCLTPAKVFAQLKSKVQKESAACGEKKNAASEEPLERNGTQNVWKTDDHKFGFYPDEAEPLTLSPIASPVKSSDHRVTVPGLAVRTQKTDLNPESVGQPRVETSVSDPAPDAQNVRTDCLSVQKKTSPAKVFSPMRNRLRKRKWEQLQFNKVLELKDSSQQPHERRTSTPIGETENLPACTEGLRGNEPLVVPPVFSPKKPGCAVALQQVPAPSPAKTFASMKRKENQKEEQQQICKPSSTEEPDDGDHSNPSGDTPVSTTSTAGKTEDIAFSDAGSVLALNRSRMEAADGKSESDPSSDVSLSPQPTQPVLLDDPLMLNSPRVIIPKINETIFLNRKWPSDKAFPMNSITFLKKWFLGHNLNGLFVSGIHREDNIPWNSNTIVERCSCSEVKTISDRIYVLVGRMNRDVDSDLPKWLLKKFAHGFPINWKILYDKFLSESRNRVSEMKSNKKSNKTDEPENNLHLKRLRPKPAKTPSPCPTSSSSGVNVSRSGRTIKPPLEYWKGGRVILDAQMNVTIHEGYSASSLISDVSTIVSPTTSQKPEQCTKGRRQCKSKREEPEVLLRKVKPPHHKRNQTKANGDEKPSNRTKHLEETLTNHNSSPEERCGRITRSNHRYPQRTRTFYTESVPRVQRQPEPHVTGQSRQQKHSNNNNNNKSSLGVLRTKHSVQVPKDDPTAQDKTSQHYSSDEEFPVKRSKRGEGVRRKTAGKFIHESMSSQSLNSSGVSETMQRKRSGAQTRRQHGKDGKMSPPPKPVPRSHNKGDCNYTRANDEDKWTEAELMRLQEAVSSYSKHRAGYWANVANMVGTRSAEECHKQHTSHGNAKSPVKRAKKSKMVEAPKEAGPDPPVISARVGTLKRKQELRRFLEAMPTENVDDAFSTAYMRSKRFELPSISSDDHDFISSDLEPLTPKSAGFPEVKTPQCLHITPGMLKSPNIKNDDKYVFQLQKRVKKNQFHVHKKAPSKRFTPTSSIKQKMRRRADAANDAFVMWEMFPDQDGSESGEEEDRYFSDNE